MIKYELRPCKQLKPLEDEKTYITENLISSFHIVLPSTFGDYPIKELELELRCYLPTVNDGVTEYSEYMGYQIDVTQKVAEIPITNDITGAVQIVKVMIIATKDGNVIGKTNFVDKQIYDAPLKGDPLTPREQFDEVIREQRETIAEQGQTITEQQGTITEQGEQITELNGEVTELQGEVAEQQATITRQNTTIDELNRRVPPLETLDPINPTTEQVTYNPESPNIGFPQVIVNAPTAEGLGFDYGNLKKDVEFLGGVGTYDPFPYNSVGGIYITEVDEDGYPVKVIAQNLTKPKVPFVYPLNNDSFSKLALKSFKFKNCLQITTLANSCFEDSSVLKEVQLPEALVALPLFCFASCSSLKEIDIPYTVKRIENYAFRYTAIEEIIIPHGVEQLGSQLFNSRALKTVSLPNTLTQIGALAWYLCYGLQNVTLENGFNCNNLDLSSSTLYSAETIVAWLEALADRTGETAYTLTIGATNIAKMTAEEIAIATNKNWNIA